MAWRDAVSTSLSFVADGGLKTLIRISALTVAAETDALGSEVVLMAANREFRVSATLQEIQDALEEDWRLGLFRRPSA